MNSPPDHRRINFGAFLTASAIAAAVFAVLGVSHSVVITAGRPSRSLRTPSGSALATAPRSGRVVYPGRTIRRDPIFTALVHELGIHIDYSVAGLAPDTVKGTEAVVLKLSGPSGWSRDYVLTPATHFTGNHTNTDVTLDLPKLQALVTKIATLTGSPASGGFSIAVGPRVKIAGDVTGHPITAKFAPALTFEPQGGQIVLGGGSGSSSSSSDSLANFTQIQRGSVSSPGTTPATVTVLGISPEIDMLRWIALIGLLLSIPLALYASLRKRGEPFVETLQIQSQYGHLIVPIVAGEDLGWPPVDVPGIKFLVRLAESGQRLILHTRSDNVDTYLVNDEGTVYRYQVKPSKVIWGEWSETPVQAAASAALLPADASRLILIGEGIAISARSRSAYRPNPASRITRMISSTAGG